MTDGGTPVGRRVVLGLVGLGALGVVFGRRLSEATEAYRRMLAAMREGCRSVQPDLFG